MVMLGDDFVARYGAEKASASPPLRAILDRDVPLGVGTDATRGSTFNPWITLHWLVTGQTASGLVLYPPENRLDRLTALEAHTVGSAWFSGEETTKGRIAPGQSADLILLSDDYFAVTEETIKSIESVLTVTAGRIVYAAAEFTPLNPPLDPVSPAWAPAAHFEPYGRKPR
jgi:predicted amidohydrolase YtcJ